MFADIEKAKIQLPVPKLPDLSNNMVNYILAVGIVALGIPIVMRFLKSRKNEKA